MVKLNIRQKEILLFIEKNEGAQNIDIKKYLEKQGELPVARLTVIRDLNFLLANKLIIKTGLGRNVKYESAIANPLLGYVDMAEYFKKDINERKIKHQKFNFGIFDCLKNNIFSAEELKELDRLNDGYKKRLKKISPTVLKNEVERLTIELSWISSRMEGNTYTLLDTEALIKERVEARGHKKEEATMIINHKNALDYILKNRNKFKKINLRQIEDIHRHLVGGLGVKFGIRKNLVRITGTNYFPLDNQYQIKEALEKALKIINRVKNPLVKALVLIAIIAYIQPFEDGNKRTSRLAANAVLLAGGYCPLSYRSINEKEYKKAIIIFYEENLITPLKELFIEQFLFAVNNYFL